MHLLERFAMNAGHLISSLFVIASCTTDQADPPGHDVDAPPRCTAATSTVTVMVARTPTPGGSSIQAWTLDAVANATSVIAHRPADDGALHAAYIDEAGAIELAVIPQAGPYRFKAAAITLGGNACATLLSDKGGMFLGCKGAAAEPANLQHLDATRRPVPFVHADGSLSVFTQSFASFTELRRTQAGTWSEIEQYESSISYPTDVAAADGEPVVCFISAGDRAVIGRGHDNELASTATTESCRIALDGTTLHVLTDGGYAKFPLEDVSGQLGTFDVAPVPALGTMRTTRLFVLDGAAYALGFDADTVKAVPLAGGQPLVLGMASQSQATIDWDDATRAVRIVTSKLDTSGPGPVYPQTLTFETHCL